MRAEIQQFRGFTDEKYFFCGYYKMKTSSKNRRLPLRTGGKTAGKKALNHKIYGKVPLEYSFLCENEKMSNEAFVSRNFAYFLHKCTKIGRKNWKIVTCNEGVFPI
jgi:hypothetical protein